MPITVNNPAAPQPRTFEDLDEVYEFIRERYFETPLFLDGDNDLFVGLTNGSDEPFVAYVDDYICGDCLIAWPLRLAPAGTSFTVEQGEVD